MVSFYSGSNYHGSVNLRSSRIHDTTQEKPLEASGDKNRD